MPTTPAGPSRDELRYRRQKREDLQALTAQVHRLADYNARLVEMIEHFLLNLPVEPKPAPVAELAAEPKPVPVAEPADRKKLLSAQEAAELLGVPCTTLYSWRHKREGPEGFRIGRHVRYEREAIDRWLERKAAEDRLTPRRDPPDPFAGSTRHGQPWREKCPTSDAAPYRESTSFGRGICGTCGAEVILKKNGRIPVHRRK